MSREDQPAAGADLVIKALLDHYLHTDRLIWQRLPYLIIINAAVWSGMYAIHRSSLFLAIIVGCVGIIFTYMLLVIVLGAIENRNLNVRLIDELLTDFLGSSTLSRMQEHARRSKAPERWLLLLAVPEQRNVYMRGGTLRFRAVWLFGIAFWMSIAIDVVFLVYVVS